MLLICLYGFVAINKFVTFDAFLMQLQNQDLFKDVATLVAIIVPVWHAVLAILLFTEKYRYRALMLSMITIIGYNIYISDILLDKLNLSPCNCIGIWHTMSWETQYLINYLLLGLHYWALLDPDKIKNIFQKSGPAFNPIPSY